MKNKEQTQKLREIINQIRMTPITAPLVALHTQNHLLACVRELEKLAAELEAEKEEEANEDYHEPK